MAKPGREGERTSSHWLQGAQRNRSAGTPAGRSGDSASARTLAEHAVYQSGLKLKEALGDTPQDVVPDISLCTFLILLLFPFSYFFFRELKKGAHLTRGLRVCVAQAHTIRHVSMHPPLSSSFSFFFAYIEMWGVE
jgi:hypothetical protein